MHSAKVHTNSHSAKYLCEKNEIMPFVLGFTLQIYKKLPEPRRKNKKYLQNYGTIAIFATEILKTIKNEEDYIITNRY